MRLTCPNCGAEYEVPDGLVPEDGRHVQCTSCQTRWYVYGGTRAIPSQDQIIHRLEQWRPSAAPPPGSGPRPVAANAPPPAETAPDAGDADDAETRAAAREADAPPAPGDAEEPERGMTGAQGEPPAAQPADAAASGEAGQAPGPTAPAKPAEPPAAPEDTDISAIIALKRARDRQRRASPDMAVAARAPLSGDAPPPRPTAPPDTTEAPLVATAARVRQSPRMELPSTETMPRAIWADSPEELQARYRAGLFLALLLYALALAAYLWSDDLARMAPGIGAALEAYAAGIDRVRVWIGAAIAGAFGGGGT